MAPSPDTLRLLILSFPLMPEMANKFDTSTLNIKASSSSISRRNFKHGARLKKPKKIFDSLKRFH